MFGKANGLIHGSENGWWFANEHPILLMLLIFTAIVIVGGICSTFKDPN